MAEKEAKTIENQNPALSKFGLKVEMLSSKIGALSRDGKNNHSNFSFISSEQMLTALRGELLESGLSVLPNIDSIEETDIKTSGGKPAIRSIVFMTFEVIDTETGFSKDFKFVGAEQDTGGKSLQQAITQCQKYFLFKLLKVSSKEDTDGDAKTTPIEGGKVDTKPNNPDKVWLTDEQFNKALGSDKVGIKATIDHYSTDTHGMKKTFREQLKAKL